MQLNNITNTNIGISESEFNPREQVEKYLIHWKWFVLSLIVAMAGAYVYMRYEKPQYKLETTILIKDDKKGGISSEMNSFVDLGILGGIKNNVDNEIEVLKARTLIKSVVLELDLNVSYFIVGRIKSSQTYSDCPIKVNFLSKVNSFYLENYSFTVKILSDSRFELYDNNAKLLGEYSFGYTIKNRLGNMVVTRNHIIPLKPDISDTVLVVLSPLENVVANYQSKLKINPVNKATSSVLNVSIVQEIKEIGIDFLNTLIEKYDEDAVADKNLIAAKTETFINNRLNNIIVELDSVETDLKTFKKTNRLTNITNDAQIFLSTANDYEKFAVTNATQLNVVNLMLQYISKSSIDDFIPSNIIPENGDAKELVSTYNKLISERNRIIISATADNQTIKKLNNQLQDLR
jgi:tyrosine-protein kinase Etk/Wzc